MRGLVGSAAKAAVPGDAARRWRAWMRWNLKTPRSRPLSLVRLRTSCAYVLTMLRCTRLLLIAASDAMSASWSSDAVLWKTTVLIATGRPRHVPARASRVTRCYAPRGEHGHVGTLMF
jgi:hypothetical protein